MQNRFFKTRKGFEIFLIICKMVVLNDQNQLVVASTEEDELGSKSIKTEYLNFLSLKCEH